MEPPANPGDSPVELELTVENVESVSDLLSIMSHFTGQDVCLDRACRRSSSNVIQNTQNSHPSTR